MKGASLVIQDNLIATEPKPILLDHIVDKDVLLNREILNEWKKEEVQTIAMQDDKDPTDATRLHSDELIQEIERLINLRLTLKQQAKYAEADEIQRQLWEEPFCVKLFDTKVTILDAGDDAHKHNPITADKTKLETTWKPRIYPKPEPERCVVWDDLAPPAGAKADNAPRITIPFLIGTVDNAHYQARYLETLHHLQEWQNVGTDPSTIGKLELEPCYLLDIKNHPRIGVKKILYEGWRQKMIPQLTRLMEQATSNSIPFVLMGEDDIRIPAHLSQATLIDICHQAFDAYPDLDLLSLGHSWKALSVKNRQQETTQNNNLLSFLQAASDKGGTAGVHASTLVAIRTPRGVQCLRDALERAATQKKQTHLDQFLFYSPYHDLSIALCDPPLVGWAEVDVTLTKSGSGHRRRGGGRLSYLPPGPTTAGDDTPPQQQELKSSDVRWVRRKLGEQKVALENNGKD